MYQIKDEDEDIGSLLVEDTDDNIVTYFPDADAQEDLHGKTGGNGREEYEEQIRQIKEEREALQAQITALKTAPVPHHSNSPQQQPSTQPNIFPNSGANDRAAVVAQLEAEYLKSPGEAMLKVYEAARQSAVEEARRSMFPVAGQQTRFAIDQFKQNAKFLPDEEQEFNKMVGQLTPETLAAADPTQLGEHLRILKAAAKGFALENRQNTPQPRVPQYAVGGTSSVGSGRSTPQKRQLTKAQKMLWDTGIENGMSPKEILEVIDKGDD